MADVTAGTEEHSAGNGLRDYVSDLGGATIKSWTGQLHRAETGPAIAQLDERSTPSAPTERSLSRHRRVFENRPESEAFTSRSTSRRREGSAWDAGPKIDSKDRGPLPLSGSRKVENTPSPRRERQTSTWSPTLDTSTN